MLHWFDYNEPWIGRTAVSDFDERQPKEMPELDRRGGGGAGSLWGSWVPWGAGVVVIALGGALVARQVSTPAPPAEATNVVTAPSVTVTSIAESNVGVPPLPATSVPSDLPRYVTAPPSASDKISVSLSDKSSRAAQSRPPADLSAEIARLDAARSAMAAGSHARALNLLRQYESAYPSGSFRPEATALRVECLVKLGRTSEARSLAERFVRQQRGSRLADRVAHIAGLDDPKLNRHGARASSPTSM